jgi:hypothetical protein
MDWALQGLKRSYPNVVLVHVPLPSQADATLKPATPLEIRLVQRCRDFGIPLIAMRQPILEDYARTKQPPFGFTYTLPWFGHPNAHCHNLIAQELWRFFNRPETLAKSTPENRRIFAPLLRPDPQSQTAKTAAS